MNGFTVLFTRSEALLGCLEPPPEMCRYREPAARLWLCEAVCVARRSPQPCWKRLSQAQPCLPPPPPQPRRSVSCLLWLHPTCFLRDALNRSGPACRSSPVLPTPFLPPQHKSVVAFALLWNCCLLLFTWDWVASCSKYASELAVSHLQGRRVKGLRVCSSSAVDVLLLSRVI